MIKFDSFLLNDFEIIVALETQVVGVEPVKSVFEHVVQTVTLLHFVLFYCWELVLKYSFEVF